MRKIRPYYQTSAYFEKIVYDKPSPLGQEIYAECQIIASFQ